MKNIISLVILIGAFSFLSTEGFAQAKRRVTRRATTQAIGQTRASIGDLRNNNRGPRGHGALARPAVEETAASNAAPGAARVIWMPSPVASGASFTFSWILDWGVLGTTSWSVMNNNTELYTDTTFTPISPNSQSGRATLSLPDGSYNLAVKLCNQAGCTTGTPFPLIVGADESKMPTAPVLSNIGNVNSGQPIRVEWNMWWGEIGSRWEALINGIKVHDSTTFDSVSDPARIQKGTASLPSTGLPNGVHTLAVRLCNGEQCSQDSKDFSIGGAPAAPAPGRPIVAGIPDSNTTAVTLTWSLSVTPSSPKGASWSVLDNFNGRVTTVFPSTTTFGPGDTAELQTGSASLTLARGLHELTVRLCSDPAICTDSTPATRVNINTPAEPLPGTPALNASGSTNGTLSVNWTMGGTPGVSWELWNSGRLMRRFTTFSEQRPNFQAGLAEQSVDNGSYTLTVKLCNTEGACSQSNPQTVTVSGASGKKPFFAAYYPSWDTPFFSAFCLSNGRYPDRDRQSQNCPNGPNSLLPDDYIKSVALLAGGIPNYMTHVVLAFAKLNKMHLYKGLSNVSGDLNDRRTSIGLNFTASSASIREAIRVLKLVNPGTKVYLALGGISYSLRDAENGWNGATKEDVAGLARLIVDLGLDGLDVDYETNDYGQPSTTPATLNQYYDSIRMMREAVDEAARQTGKPGTLTLAAWSIGADCMRDTRNADHPQCIDPNALPAKNRLSYFGVPAGRELIVLQKMGAMSMIDMILVMSYDAGYRHFDPVIAYQQYRAITPAHKQVAIGIESSPQGAENAVTTINAGETCRGNAQNPYANVVEQDQYGDVTQPPAAYTIERLVKAIQPGDGVMFWAAFLQNPSEARMRDGTVGMPPCGGRPLPTVTEMGQAISRFLGVGDPNNPMRIDRAAAQNYGRSTGALGRGKRSRSLGGLRNRGDATQRPASIGRQTGTSLQDVRQQRALTRPSSQRLQR